MVTETINTNAKGQNKMKEIKVRITFTENVLGSSPANEELYKEYIASKSPDAGTIEDEIEAIGVDEVTEKAMTIFPKLPDGTPFIYDYQIRGFFKEMCGILKKLDNTVSSRIKAHKKLIDNYVFIAEREIPIELNGLKIDICQRPLRASTPQGERVALAMSEEIPAGAQVTFTVQLMTEGDKTVGKTGYVEALTEWLDYGKFKGFGQWRNAGFGRFTYEILE